MPDESHRRLARAEAARTLLELHAQDALAEPGCWTWEVLDRLPLWCLLDAERRRRLQLIAGAVLLGPEIRLWLERERLERVEALIGREALAGLLEAADVLAATRGVGTPPSAGEDTGPATIEARLLASGAAVLLGTLHPSLPLGGLADSLGTPAGVLPAETAGLLFAHAERLALAADPPAGRPGDARPDDDAGAVDGAAVDPMEMQA